MPTYISRNLARALVRSGKPDTRIYDALVEAGRQPGSPKVVKLSPVDFADDPISKRLSKLLASRTPARPVRKPRRKSPKANAL